MSESYSVVMTGKVAAGQDLAQVKANVGKLFKLGSQQLDKMFTGKPVAVRKGISREQADKICAALMKAGAEAKVRSNLQTASAPAPEQPAQKPKASVKVVAGTDAAPAASKKPAAAADTSGFRPDLECPRCGHEQAFTRQCGLCKMDLTLHIQRLERKEKVRAFRRKAEKAAG